MKETTTIGMMSGSSLDGLDIALVRFQEEGDNYRFHILEAETLPYPEHWKTMLTEAFHKQPEDLVQLDKDYGKYLGEQVLTFAKKHGATPDFVASHGHTIFHRPEEHYTLQIGDGQELAKACGFTVINDFRSEDVSKGGQGAPLVPIGDKLLFGDYEICLNIGGIANLSYDEGGKRIAYDLCIANQALNYLANMNGLDYDRDGELARSGEVDITFHPSRWGESSSRPTRKASCKDSPFLICWPPLWSTSPCKSHCPSVSCLKAKSFAQVAVPGTNSSSNACKPAPSTRWSSPKSKSSTTRRL